jgi:hypothetical protein
MNHVRFTSGIPKMPSLQNSSPRPSKIGFRTHIKETGALQTKFEPIQLKGDARWCVRITLPHEVQSHISGFKTEAEARTWIGENSPLWLTSYESAYI